MEILVASLMALIVVIAITKLIMKAEKAKEKHAYGKSRALLPKVSVIIPAYNEIPQVIQKIVDVLAPYVLEVIVVCDGSVRRLPELPGARMVYHLSNYGKGQALKTGVEASRGEIIIFLDADLLNLKLDHILGLLYGLRPGIMVVGIFRPGLSFTKIANFMFPILSGTRAFYRKDVEAMFEKIDVSNFGIEIAITACCLINGIRTRIVTFSGVSQLLKEQKADVGKDDAAWARKRFEQFARGFRYRMKMYREIIGGIAWAIKNRKRLNYRKSA
ncbi:MAG: Glycosyl transferase family 2 [candidate division CPR2 bacterium GW2011_GWC1_41_48]|uniref:Glycosyl transferase family 2 n=1 Tax=candidate division CPR2 bacterium GW2011_GWC1_41_48 TaxID=1618344 RepID=A0A0G0W912_UNCC2|nr:MAG: Glycosyl transferase family 2 [candidate division CPR2 bacterium GW2011_GWC2_39_35]KKR27657.1 MAG: Glycosyl transferase family 2 [candidate division CPR2 bacterium GW2011_GWD1_39_7]KKR28992.1 MAG: Glycosyl transferase family 2 [candidate division CPR2 bacterium GW2011_GWD2_39_7]KKS09489.1 MAG: Glycosyl transferase family 2 [candidate division CPR2 bacterium GW2011_GWC1_41_48]OGB59527.1 MAG: hypothetical protein A2Y27_01730 [candidate division CPR2 bacterium GWD1_39_7]OGB70392.1 MAG: hy